ncbi:MAG: FecR family protein [Planctomycetales bacterium]|nr:FecR family protein [Planctomycetales bacterium]
MTAQDKHLVLEELILKSMDGTIGHEEHAELNCMLGCDANARTSYLGFIVLYGELLSFRQNALANDVFYCPQYVGQSALWQALAEAERTAETIPIEKPQPVNSISPINKDAIVRKPHHVSRLALYTAVIATAALLLIIGYVVTHPRTLPDPTATVTGQTQAVWAETTAGGVGDKSRLYTHSTLKLMEGFAEITFDSQARIILQSPVEIDIEDYGQIFLRSGKLAARVPPTAVGFVVRTPGASIVDYGTEFGVTADFLGRTEAQVFEGRVELRTGADPIRFAEARKLTSGQAGQVDQAGKLTVETRYQPASYVRNLPAAEHFGQPGKRIDLADIVGGGSGFGTGRQRITIDPAFGRMSDDFRMFNRKLDPQRYCPIPAMSYIDGVFVPVGGTVPQVVTSQGHTFSQCPQTTGEYWMNLTNYPVASFSGDAEKQPEDMQPAILNGIQYGTPQLPAIMMHANLGVTFDLDAIRAAVPGTRILRFTSIAGLAGSSEHKEKAAVSQLWVLVDGQNRQEARFVQGQMPSVMFFSVDIQGHDRFLTLMATDGGDGNGGDWTIFANPALELQAAP